MLNFDFKSNKSGFSLMELLIIIAIIGILAGIIFVSVRHIRESARIAKTVVEIRSIENAFEIFYFHTKVLPGVCRADSCTALNDPFLNSLGVTGWSGPYIGDGLYRREHAWGGHMGIENVDYDTNGIVESFLIIDDDPPGGTPADTGQISNKSLLEIDQKIDDGNLSTGNFRSIVPGVSTDPGSAVYIILP
jgi:prepilin-type N-terminal cleavage/methylation domain-containing protein